MYNKVNKLFINNTRVIHGPDKVDDSDKVSCLMYYTDKYISNVKLPHTPFYYLLICLDT